MTEITDEQCCRLSDLLTRVHLGDDPEEVITEAAGTEIARAIAKALAIVVPTDSGTRDRPVFTKSQYVILEMLASGWRAPDLARSLGVGVSTIHTQVLKAKRLTGYEGPVTPWLDQLVADGLIRPAWRSSA